MEEELIGEFVKYSIRDGKEINFLRRESEAGQKCCTFQHWVYQKTSGCLLVTDMQGEQGSLARVPGMVWNVPGGGGEADGTISWVTGNHESKFSFSMNMPVLDISCEWNHIRCV